jgi:hypothetical protein
LLFHSGFFSLVIVNFEEGKTGEALEGLNNKILSVAGEHHFTPAVIDALFADAIDHHGLDWWYNDIEKRTKKE